MGIKFSNLATTTLASGITNSATTITVADGSVFPALGSGDFFFASIDTPPNAPEIVKVTAISSNTLTVVRGQDGTTATSHNSSETIALRVVAAALEDLRDNSGETYTAGSGITLTGTVFSNSAPDQTVALTGSGGTTISGTYPNFTISSAASIDGTTINPAAVQIGGTAVIDSSRNLTNIGTISSGAITVTGTGTTAAKFINSGYGGYVNIASNVGGVGTDGSVGLHIGWNRSNGGREVNMIFDGGTTQAETEMIFTSTDGSAYTDIFQINGGGNVDIKSGGLRIGTTAVIDSSRNLVNIGTLNGGTPFTTANDGSGSGLDADLLDGLHASSLVRSDTDDSFTGNNLLFPTLSLNISNNNSIGSSNTYFRGNSTHFVFGLTSGNTLYMNYGNGSGAFRLDGNVYVNSNFAGNVLWGNSNDGSGSGLDADTVDGIQGASFLRSDASDSIAAGTTYTFGTSDTEGLRFTNSSYAKSLYIGGWSGANSSGISRIRNSNDNLHLDAGSAGNLYLNHYCTGTVYARGQVVWHAGNDGSGSGLDADLLDGQQGSHYNQSQFTGSTFTSRNNTNPIAIDSVTTNMVGYVNSSSAAGFGDGAGFSAAYSSSWVGQLFVDFRTGKLSTRGKNNGTWQAHRFMWDNLNDGSGSGLDADTVDGIQGASFLRSDATDTATGSVSLRAGGSHLGNHEFAASSTGSSYSVAAIELRESNYSASGSATPPNLGFHWGNVVASNISMDSGGAILIRNNPGTAYENFRANNIYANGTNLVWHTGNDGSGSGLDADLLDGTNGGLYLKGGAGDAVSGWWINQARNGSSGSPRIYFSHSSGYGQHINTYNTSGSVYAFELHNNVKQLFGVYNDGAVKANGGNLVWHAGNDGSGSGLDADTVDGVQASSIVQLTGNPVITGQKYFQSNRNTSSNSPALQAYSTGNTGAIMSFHRAGYYAINMGLDSDNVFRIGGWSAATNRFQMDTSGNLTMAGNVTAYSDIRLKENIKVIPDALSKVQQIRGVTFTRNDAEDLEKLHTGVIAQEVETVLPEAVSEDNDGIKNVAYGNMIGLLIESIKELKAEVDDLKTQLENK